jgi:hypothetical protein
VSITDAQFLALAAKWRARARTYMHEAQECSNVRDVYRLAGMASSLNFAARDLCWTADVDPSAGPSVANPEANRARMEIECRLAEDAEAPHG